MIRIFHPKNGYHVVYSEVDVLVHAKLGWTKVIETLEVKEDVKEDDTESLKAEYFLKFGVKPHHMAKRATILKAINGNS